MKDMKYTKNIIGIGVLGLLFMTTAGSSESDAMEEREIMTFRVVHPNASIDSRVTETAFETNDQIGLFLTEQNVPLEVSGNYVNNASLSFMDDEWLPEKTIYWNEGNYDAYAYFPYVSPVPSVDDMPFTVSLDQSVPENYEASDFLWAGKKGLVASDGDVNLQFSHRMSRLVVKLVKGEDYEGDLPEEAEVLVHNTVPSSTIDLSVGIVTRNAYAAAQTIRAKSLGDQKYAAIIVPQRLNNRQPLVEVVMKGVSYLYESRFLFKPGIQHNVLLVVSKNPEQIKIEIGGEIEDWN